MLDGNRVRSYVHCGIDAPAGRLSARMAGNCETANAIHMAIREIIIAPDPVLRKTAAKVEAVDDQVRSLMDDMLETMYEAPGIGLAAPQIGVLRRVIVVDVSAKDEERQPLCMADPEVVWTSKDTFSYEEGCLSLPEHYAEVTRPAEAKIRYLDRDNAPQELHAKQLLATCIQHEIDHLDGILFVDYLSTLRRGMILRKLTKMKKANAA